MPLSTLIFPFWFFDGHVFYFGRRYLRSIVSSVSSCGVFLYFYTVSIIFSILIISSPSSFINFVICYFLFYFLLHLSVHSIFCVLSCIISVIKWKSCNLTFPFFCYVGRMILSGNPFFVLYSICVLNVTFHDDLAKLLALAANLAFASCLAVLISGLYLLLKNLNS